MFVLLLIKCKFSYKNEKCKSEFHTKVHETLSIKYLNKIFIKKFNFCLNKLSTLCRNKFM